GLSARAQTIAESTERSPDWTPWVMTGRSAARLSAGLAMPPAAAITADEAAGVKKRRRVSDAPLRMTAIGPPPSNQRRGSCPPRHLGAARGSAAAAASTPRRAPRCWRPKEGGGANQQAAAGLERRTRGKTGGTCALPPWSCSGPGESLDVPEVSRCELRLLGW